jgi:GT2 family glycosyltransferase
MGADRSEAIVKLSSRVANVGVALINWNNAPATIRCVDSLRKGTAVPRVICVLDNGSVDGSVAAIRAAHPNVDLVECPENSGFAAGTNRQVERLLAAGVDYVWILNNDTVVEQACLETLIAFAEAHSEYSALSATIMVLDRPQEPWYAGGRLDMGTIAGRHLLTVGERAVPVDFLSGCCMFCRRDTFERAGNLDERFFAYGEDVDWCVRAKQAGLTLGYVPAARLYHEVSSSIRRNTITRSGGTASPFHHYLVTRNACYLVRKHAARHRVPWLLLRITVRAAALSVAQLLLLRWDKPAALARGLKRGILDPLDGHAARG